MGCTLLSAPPFALSRFGAEARDGVETEDLLGTIDDRWRHSVTRREALLSLAGILAGSPLLARQLDPRPLKDHKRVPGLSEMLTAFDFEPVCFANMPLFAYDYMAHGCDGEFTLRRNRQAFEWVDLVERPGTSAASVDTSSEVLGLKLEYPILIAPSSRQRDLHPEADAGMYKGATAAKTPMIVIGSPSIPIEKLAASADGPRWSQFYPNQDLNASREQIERVQAAGAQGIVVTVDQQASLYERDLHNRNLGGNPRRAAVAAAPPAATKGPWLYRVNPRRLWYHWDYLHGIRPFIKGPMVIKGILTAEDARLCLEHGADGIIVSNHGGRSMDYGPSSLEALPEVVEAVSGKVPVMVDSGFRSGSDIAKAIALGASAVCLGRAARWGLGAFGPQGVQRLLEIVQAEFRDAMAKAGCATLASLNRSAIRANFT
jgi:4-hydroxymandelate oxidase